MARGDKIVGVDISFSKVSMMIGQVDNYDQIQEIAAATKKNNIPREDNAIGMNEEILTNALKEVKKEVEEISELKIKSASVMIAGDKTNIIHIEIEEEVKNKNGIVTEEDVISAIIKTGEYMPPKGEWIVDIIPDRFKLDTGTITRDPLGKRARKFKLFAQLVSCKTEYVEKIQEVFSKSGLMIDNFAPKILAEKNLYLDSSEQTKNVLLIDMGAKNTEFGVLYDGTYVYGDTVNSGGDDITRDIEYVFQINKEEAERLKIDYPNALKEYVEADNKILLTSSKESDPEKRYARTKEVSFLIEERVKNIIKEVAKKIKKTEHAQNIEMVILAGNGITTLKYSDILVERMVGVKVRKAHSKILNIPEPDQRMTYALIRYLNLKPFAKNIESNIDTGKEKNIFFRMLEKVKDFFYT